MQKINILIVDDESRIRHLLKLFFEKEGWDTCEAEDGLAALEKISNKKYDLVILDIMMPKLNGWEVCKKINTLSDVPIIMLTSLSQEQDRINGFELGAFDYIVKPFNPIEVVLRIKAILKRTISTPPEIDFISTPDLYIDVVNHKVMVSKKEINLSPLEYSLFSLLSQKPGVVFTREKLLNEVWGYEFSADTRTVDACAKRLREKLSTINPDVANYIKTIWGIGYKFEVK